MTKLVFGFLALAAALCAADITGTWSGPMSMTENGETRDDRALLVLKQDGGKITGTIGPNEEKRLNITAGTIDGDNVHIEAIVEGENRIVLTLKLEGEKLVGDLKAVGPTAPSVSGKMTLDRKKP